MTAGDGVDKYKVYNFVMNVYGHFVLDHRKRIKHAVATCQPLLSELDFSFEASDLALDDTDSEDDSQENLSQENEAFRKPGKPAGIAQNRELVKPRKQMDKLLQQLEQQRKDSKEEKERIEGQIRQQLEQ